MRNTQKFYWPAQFFGWIAYSALLTLSVFNNDPENVNRIFLYNVAILIVAGILTTHIQRVIFIRLGWLEHKLPKLLPRLILSSFLSSIAISAIDIVSDHYTGIGGNQGVSLEISSLITNVFAVLMLVLFWNAIYFTFHFFQKSRKQEISNLELKATNKESELKNLRSQLNPHFLFNSLNSIKALIDVDPSKAKISITTLSNLLRQSLLLGKENLVSLESELNLSQSYLELEKIRFEERLMVEWELTPGLEQFQIPPFALQMMVENAIKHGISNLKNGGTVKISIKDSEEHVSVEVINSGNLNDVIDLGLGIRNIKERLALQYEHGAEFSLEELDGMVISKMRFKK